MSWTEIINAFKPVVSFFKSKSSTPQTFDVSEMIFQCLKKNYSDTSAMVNFATRYSGKMLVKTKRPLAYDDLYRITSNFWVASYTK